MKNSIALWRILPLILLLHGAGHYSSSAQIVEADIGIGYAAVDVESWSGISEDGFTYSLYDWSNTTGYASLQVLFPVSPSVAVGAGAGYQHLLWYEYKYYYDLDYGYFYYVENSVDASRFMAIVRLTMGKNFIDLQAGAYVFGEYTDPTLGVSFGRSLRLTDRLSIPLRVNASFIADSDANMFPVTVSSGLSYKIK